MTVPHRPLVPWSATRARYLLAMGLLSPVALAGSACRRAATPSGDVKGDVVADASTALMIDASMIGATDASVIGATDASVIGAMTDASVIGAVTDAPLKSRVSFVRHDAGANFWTLEERRVDTSAPPELPRATCPSGMFCTVASTQPDAGRAGPTSNAPAPYGDCPAMGGGRAPAGVIGAGEVRFRPDLTQSERAERPNACCYSWYEHCPGGRPLRTATAVLVADTVLREDWSPPHALAAITELDLRERLARHWLAEASAEHASIASFGRFSLQLLALGAPRDLVVATHEAALDEVRHAEDCYALAARMTGGRYGPGPLPLPADAIPTDPAVVARETLHDGCLGESLASRCAAEASALARDAHVAEVLTRIAVDEASHAELAWRTVAWLLVRDGENVRPVVSSFLTEAREISYRVEDDGDGAGDGDEAHGVLGARRRRRIHRDVLREVVIPCLEALLASTTWSSPRRNDPGAEPGHCAAGGASSMS